MKKILLATFFLGLFYACTYAQTFQKGYFIDNMNSKTECLIKMTNWNANPSSFKYKLSEVDEKVYTVDIKKAKEFGVDKGIRFVRYMVDLDVSSDLINRPLAISKNREPILEKRLLYLTYIVDGEADLFLYKEGELRRFFYRLYDESPQPLIFKEYLTPEKRLARNNKFRQQLFGVLKCASVSSEKLAKLKYFRSDLTKVFEQYNKCKNQPYEKYMKQHKTGSFFNLVPKAGINFSSLKIRDALNIVENLDFSFTPNLTLALEVEFLLSQNKKWSAVLEPSYSQYKAYAKTSSGKEAVATYNTIDIFIGAKYLIFNQKDIDILAEGGVVGVGGGLIGKNFTYEPSGLSIDHSGATFNFAVGVVARYKKFQLNLRYYTPKNISILDDYFTSKHQKIDILVGYNLF